MPQTAVYFYQEKEGEVPVWDWLKELRKADKKAFAKCARAIQRLIALGHELRRPEADFLRDGIYELRTKRGRVQYRILYFFHGRNVAVLAHSLTKEKEVPDRDIDRAAERKARFEEDPDGHTFEGEVDNENP